VTFLFTDLESSTRLWEERREEMSAALEQHDALLLDAIAGNGGRIVKYLGDGCLAVFSTAGSAVAAAIAAQRALSSADWGGIGGLRARMGLHTGEAIVRDGDYFGPTLNRASRLASLAHGGQVVCSNATAELTRDVLSADVILVDLGEHSLRDVTRREHVFQINAAGLPHVFPPLRSVEALRGNLPIEVSSFIGRELDMARVAAALEDARIVTVTGAGGVGKTRLALRLASELQPVLREGAWLIELAPVREQDGVEVAFAAAFGLTARGGMTLVDTLVDVLRSKQLLLVVDNCEHVLDPCAALVDQIIHSCPRVRVLATSREGLALDAERVVPLQALGGAALDSDVESAAEAPAVGLFVERANAVDPDFALTEATVSSVVQICRRLDGLPLAIELAAARVTSMNPAELAAALDHRFDVLAGARRGAVKRQQTLRATIDWSYDLLDAPQQALLGRLSVFVGGCTRDAAEEVCSGEPVDRHSVPDLLASLVARSLLSADRSAIDTRFRLSETIREYAEEQIAAQGETYDLRDRHARYFARYLRKQAEMLNGPDEIVAGKRIGNDSDNALAAHTHALDHGDLDLAMALLAATPLGWSQVGAELILGAEPVLALTGAAEHPGYPLALLLAGVDALYRGDVEVGLRRFEEADEAQRALRGPPVYSASVAFTANAARGVVAFSGGDWEAGADLFLAAGSALVASGVHDYPDSATAAAAFALAWGGRDEEARALAIEGLGEARAVGSPQLTVGSLCALALASARSDPDGARAAVADAVDLMVTLESENSFLLTWISHAAAITDDPVLTATLAARAIRALHWASERPLLSGVLLLAARALAEADPEAAAVIQSAGYSLATSTQARAPSASRAAPGAVSNRETSRIVNLALGDERIRSLRHMGASMDLDDSVAYSLGRLDAFVSASTDLHHPG